MKALSASIIMLFLSSCFSLNKKNHLYGKCEKHYFSCAQLELKQNNEFEYYVFLDVGGGQVIKGTWRYLNGDTLILNTYKQPHISKTYFKTIENSTLSDDTVVIKLQNYLGPIVDEYVNINNGEQEQFTNDKGICIFKTKEVRQVAFYLEDSPLIEKVIIDVPQSNQIEIFAKDSEPGIPETITNELIVAKRKKVIFLPKNEDTLSYTLKRTRLGEKQWR